MNLSIIKEKQRFKNWGEFCELVELPLKKDTRAIQRQKKDLERYCKIKWLKNSREFVIEEVYLNPLPKNSRQGAGGKYSDLLEELLPYVVPSEFACISTYMSRLGMIDVSNITATKDLSNLVKALFVANTDVEEFIEDVDRFIEPYIIIARDFFNQTRFVSEAIKTKLDSLERRGVIDLQISHKFVHGDYEPPQLATAIDEAAIQKCEKIALKELKLQNKSEVFLKHKFDVFYSKSKHHLKERYDIDCYFYYKVYKTSYLHEIKGRRLSEARIERKKLELKTLFIEQLRANIDRNKNAYYLSKKTGINIEFVKSIQKTLLDHVYSTTDNNKALHKAKVVQFREILTESCKDMDLSCLDALDI